MKSLQCYCELYKEKMMQTQQLTPNASCFGRQENMTHLPAEEAQDNHQAVGDKETTCGSYRASHQIHTTGYYPPVAWLTFGNW
jgi:hypothetical protein